MSIISPGTPLLFLSVTNTLYILTLFPSRYEEAPGTESNPLTLLKISTALLLKSIIYYLINCD